MEKKMNIEEIPLPDASDSIQRRADFLIECLRESTDAELRRFFVNLGDWIIADERVMTMFNSNLLDLYFAEMDQRR